MSLFARTPAPVRALLDGRTEPAERVLAWSELAAGGWAVATDRALWTSGAEEPQPVRLGWEEINRVVWDAGVLRIEPVEGPPRALPLADPGRLPEAVRDRVTASVLLSRYERVSSAGGVRVVARRRPGSDRLLWSLVPDDGVDLHDADVAPRVAALTAAAREAVGDPVES